MGPFSQPFIVLWKEISVERTKSFAMDVASLKLGKPRISGLTISAHVANRLAHAAGKLWPEPDPPAPAEWKAKYDRLHAYGEIFAKWLVLTIGISAVISFGRQFLTGMNSEFGYAFLILATLLSGAIVWWDSKRRS